MGGAAIRATENQTTPAQQSKLPRTGARQVRLLGRDGNAVTASRNPMVPALNWSCRRTRTSTIRETDGTATNLTKSGMANVLYLNTMSTFGIVN